MKDEEIQRISDFEEDYWWFIGRKKIIQTIIENELDQNRNIKILDVGCGPGGTTLVLKRFGTVIGIDFSFSALQFSIKRGLQVLKGAVNKLPFLDETFDMITMFDAIEHMEDDLLVVKELSRILKKTGIIFITVPAYHFLWSPHDVAESHYRRYNSKSLSSVVTKGGLSISRMSYFITILFPFIALFRLLSKLNVKKPKSDIAIIRFPKFIDKIFRHILFFESKLLQKINLPFGLSLICVAKIKST